MLPGALGILPLRGYVLFPTDVVPLEVTRPESVALLREVAKNTGLLGVVTQKNSDLDVPTAKDLHEVGTLAKLVKLIKRADGKYEATILGLGTRVRLKAVAQQSPYFKATVEALRPVTDVAECEPLVEQLRVALRGVSGTDLPGKLVDQADGPTLVMLAFTKMGAATVSEQQTVLGFEDLADQLRVSIVLLQRHHAKTKK